MDLGGFFSGAGLVVLGLALGVVLGFALRDHVAVFLSELLTWGDDR